MLNNKNKKEGFSMAFFLITAVLFCGCGATKRIEGTEVPKQPEANEKGTVQKGPSVTRGHYLVESHDCLWTIAGQSGVYGDSFEWPLIFKANRDQIKDPDLIYPKQDFLVEKGVSAEQLNHARQMAMATPKYVPHTKARETLPVDYF